MKQKEDPEQSACSSISTEAAKIKDRGIVCKVLKDLPKAGGHHAFHISG